MAYILDKGRPQNVFEKAATGSGDTFIIPFQPDNPAYLILQAIGIPAAATITALVVDLEVSLDGGTTWAKLVTAIDLNTGATAKRVDVSGLESGALCRLTSTTFTLGTATSLKVMALAG